MRRICRGWGMRALANGLAARAMMRLEAGDSAGFSRDVVTEMRFARLLAQQPSLIEHLVAVGIDSLAMQCVQAGAASGLASTSRR